MILDLKLLNIQHRLYLVKEFFSRGGSFVQHSPSPKKGAHRSVHGTHFRQISSQILTIGSLILTPGNLYFIKRDMLLGAVDVRVTYISGGDSPRESDLNCSGLIEVNDGYVVFVLKHVEF